MAIHQHGMYPLGHPSLEQAAVRATDRLTYLLREKGTLSLGAAKDQLVIEGVATDENSHLLRELAGRMHRHHLGAISFHQGVSNQEIRLFLSLLAEEPDQTGEPLGLAPAWRREQQPNIRMHPVAYDSLRLMEDDGSVEEDEEARRARTRYAQLWVGLAKAAVARGGGCEQPSEEEVQGHPEAVSRNPAAVAQAISERSESQAYDQVIVGYLLQIVQELQTAKGPEAVQLNQRMGELVSAMEPDALARLLEMGGDSGQRRQFLMNAARGLKGDSVLRLVQAASQAEGKEVSNPMLRMLGKLAQHADGSPGIKRQHALESIQEQVSDLVTGWESEDPNPEAYTSALSEMVAAEPGLLEGGVPLPEVGPRRVVDMAFEMDLVGDTVADAVRRLIATEQASWLLERVADNKSSALTHTLIGSPDDFGHLLHQLLDSEPVDPSILDAFLGLVGDAAVVPMMQGLLDSESRQVRRLLLDRLVTLQPEIQHLAIQHLNDSRWYVTRNMLWLLNGVEHVPEEFVPDPYLQHKNESVRYEAVRLGTRSPRGREKAINIGLADANEKTVRLALNAALVICPNSALPKVASWAFSGPTDVRLLAVRVLEAVGTETAVSALLKLTEPKRGLFGLKHPAKDPVYLAALRALCSSSYDPRVLKVLELARARRDPEIAAAAREGGELGG
jgi:HEAT repeat protein